MEKLCQEVLTNIKRTV